MTGSHDDGRDRDDHTGGPDELDRLLDRAMAAEIPEPGDGYWERIDRTLAGIADGAVTAEARPAGRTTGDRIGESAGDTEATVSRSFRMMLAAIA